MGRSIASRVALHVPLDKQHANESSRNPKPLGCAEQGAGDVPHDRLARSEDAFDVVPHHVGVFDLAGGHRCRKQISPPFRVEMAWTCRSTKLPKVPCTALGYQLAMCKMRGVEAGSAAMGTKVARIWLNINERTSSLLKESRNFLPCLVFH